MRQKPLRHPLMGIGLALTLLALVIGLPLAARAQGPSPQSTAAALGTAFTYQGRLTKNNTPVNGTCDFQFSLWDAASGGSQVGSTVTKSGVNVQDGMFSATLDFGSSAFTGDARYLQVEVKCSGESSYTDLGRVALNGTPYALGLRSGITVQGSESGRVFGAINTDSSGSNAALYGEATSSSGAGVSGWNTASSGGYGVYGRNTANAGTPYGVYGLASGSSATSYGVYGKSESYLGSGVGGEGHTGVYGKAAGGTLINPSYGVYAEAESDSSVSYAIYSKGDTHVDGLLTWKPITGYLSIPAAAFVPADNYSSNTLNSGAFIRPNGTLPENVYAAVHLPHNARITKMTAHWKDNDPNNDGTITLYRSTSAGSLAQIAQVSTSGSSGNGSSTDSNVNASYAQVDNANFLYYVNAYLPTDGTNYVGLYGVIIEYTIGQPH